MGNFAKEEDPMSIQNTGRISSSIKTKPTRNSFHFFQQKGKNPLFKNRLIPIFTVWKNKHQPTVIPVLLSASLFCFSCGVS
jgi:hypothetical protein